MLANYLRDRLGAMADRSQQSAGVMHAAAGWTVINVLTLPLMLAIVFAAMRLSSKQRAEAARPVGT